MKKIILSLLLCVSLNAFAAELHKLIKSGTVDQVREYLDRHPEDVDHHENEHGHTPLFWTVAYRDVEFSELLLDYGADVNHQDRNKQTALFYAAMSYGHNEKADFIIRFLIYRGARVDHEDMNKETALFSSVLFGYVNATNALLDCDADVNHENKWKKTPLLTAVLTKNVEIVRLLIDRGADVKHENEFKNTPLSQAVALENVDIVRLLIDSGADVNYENKDKYTPLFNARNVEVARLLIDRGANVNHENKFKETPLFWAAIRGHVDIVRLLLDRGASKPFDVICSKMIKDKGDQEIIQLLKDKNMLTDDSSSEKAKQVPDDISVDSVSGFPSKSFEINRPRQIRSTSNFVVAKKSSVTFSDVGGYERVKQQLQDYIKMIKNSERYKKFGIKQAPHVLLYGPPGTGKTLFAMATAGECDIPFLLVSGSELIGCYLGESAERIRNAFAEIKQEACKKRTPGFLIIDELDSIGGDRRNFRGNLASERIATLNQLLTELDGGNNKGDSQELAGTVFVIGITNFVEMLDQALLRAGRLSRHIFVGLPNKEERQLILETYKRYPFSSDVDFSVIAEETDGFSGADLAQLLEEAALAAVKNIEQDDITMSDILTALDTYKASRSMSSKNPLVEFGELFEVAVKERSRL